jgi:hypothetical protein
VSVETPLLELRGISKRFVKALDATARIANLFGAGLREEVGARATEQGPRRLVPGMRVRRVATDLRGKACR